MVTFIVINNNSSGPGSFRDAIENSNLVSLEQTSIINFSDTYTIILDTLLPTITRNVIVNGNNSIISGNNNNRHLTIVQEVSSQEPVIINELSFVDGYGINSVASILINSTNVTFNDVKFTNNMIFLNGTVSSPRGCCIEMNGENWTLGLNSTYDNGMQINNNVISSNLTTNLTSLISAINNNILINPNQTTISNISISNNQISKDAITSLFNSLIMDCLSLNATGLYVQNNFTTSITNTSYSRFISINGSGNNYLHNCIFNNNGVSNMNGVVYIGSLDATMNIKDCKFTSNKGLCVRSNGIVNITSTIDNGTEFSTNRNAYIIDSLKAVVIEESSKQIYIYNNTAGIKLGGPNNIIRNCHFTSNTSGEQVKAIRITNESSILNCKFENFTNSSYIVTSDSGTSSSNYNIILANSTFNNVNCNASICYIMSGRLKVANLLFDSCSSFNGMINAVNSIINTVSIARWELSDKPCIIQNCTGSSCSGIRIVNNKLSMDVDISKFTLENNGDNFYCPAVYLSNIDIDINSETELIVNNNIGGNYSFSNCRINMADIVSTTIPKNSSSSFINMINGGLLNLTNCKITNSSEITTTNSNMIANVSGIMNITNCEISGYETAVINNSGTTTIRYSNIYSINPDTIIIRNNYNTAYDIIVNIENSLIRGGSYGLSNTNKSRILNSTITESKSGIYNNPSNDVASIDIINSTISHNLEYGLILSSTIIVGNTIISNNGIADINNSALIFTSLGSNCISDNSGMGIFTHPTDLNDTDPMLEMLTNNGGPTDTYALIADSPCIDVGNIHIVEGYYDQRGEGYNRIVNELVDIGSYEHQNSIVCFKPDSLVSVINDKYGIHYMKAIDVNKDGREDRVVVFDECGREIGDMRVIENVVTGPKSTFIKICRNEINPNVPFEDVYFTGGHMIVVDGYEIKARDLLSRGYGMKVNKGMEKDIESNVHTLILDNRSYIKVNGILNVAFGIDEWREWYRRNK